MKIYRNLFITTLVLMATFSANAQNISYSYSEPGFSITLSNGGYGYYNNYPNYYSTYPAPNVYAPPVYYAPAPIYYGPPVTYYPNYQYRQPPRYGHRHDFRGHGYNNDRFRR